MYPRRHFALYLTSMAAVLALSACQGAVLVTHPVAAAGPTAPRSTSLWTYTYPPARNNGSMPRFIHYGPAEGLSQSSVQVVLQDNYGFLWIGTQDGLDRFDGYSFSGFKPRLDDLNALSDGYISSIVQGKDGAIWVGTHGGLNRYDPETGAFHRFQHDDNDLTSLASDTVQAMYQDEQGGLWLGTAQGLDLFSPATGQFQHIALPDDQSKSGDIASVNALYRDHRGALWIGTNNGLIRLDLQTEKSDLYQSDVGNNESLSFNDVNSIAEAADGTLWIGTLRGLNRLNPASGKFTQFLHSDDDPTSLADNTVTATYIDRAGELWIGTANGLDRFNPEKQSFVHYRHESDDPASLSNNYISSIYEDRGGMLWVGTIAGGLDEYDRSQDEFAYYHHIDSNPQSLSGDIVLPILPTPEGKVWMGTYQAGLNLFDPATGQSDHFLHDPVNPDSLLVNTVTALYSDPDGTLWIGTTQGLDRLNRGSLRFVHYVPNTLDPKSIPFGAVDKIYRDRQGNYWIGTDQGLRLFDPTTAEFSKLKVEGSQIGALNVGPIRAIYQDHNGVLWFGTNVHGVIRYDASAETYEDYVNIPNTPDSLSSNTVLDIFEDSRGTLWIATEAGLDRFVPAENGFVRYSKENGLPSDVVYGILQDRNDGDLWLSTDFGISRFSPVAGAFENFTIEDGLQSNEFNAASFAEDAGGRMYFGGISGLSVFNPEDIRKNSYIPPVVITSITTQPNHPSSSPAERLQPQEITLTYPQSSFDFSFVALSYSKPYRNRYEYILEGFDKTWVSSGPNHHGSYSNLPGGTYTLRVRASNGDGVWNVTGASVKITILPPFWETRPFQGLAAIVLLVAAVLAYQWRERGIQAQQLELAAIIRDRTQDLKKKNRDLEALFSADEKMLRVLTLDQVLQALVDVAVEILQADKSAVFTQIEPGGEFTVRVARGFNAEAVEALHFSGAQDAVSLAAASGNAIAISDTMTDALWQRQRAGVIETMQAEGMRSLMYIPIKVQDTVLGVLNVCSSQLSEFDEDRQRLFASLAQRAALSIENNLLFEQTKYMAILEERNRLARDLHDSAKQKAFAALAQLGTAKRLMVQNNGGAGKYVTEAENIITEVIRDLMFLIQELYPKDLREKGLTTSLRNYAFEWESRFGIHLNLSIVGERSLPLDMEQTMYRIVHEGLSNIARHSQATQADIQLVYREADVEISIGDNGIGFDPQKPAGGLGLRLIHERADKIGGRVDVQSRPGEGTHLIIRVPIRKWKQENP